MYVFCTGTALLNQLTVSHDADDIPVPSPPSNLSLGTDGNGLSAKFAPSVQDRNSGKKSGTLIINADDWGFDRETTDRTYDCLVRKTISSVSAMVFMEDSERAASIAHASNVDVGLHLNLTAPFTAKNCLPNLVEKQQDIAKRLMRHRLAKTMFYPSLTKSFEYVVAAQIDEFTRLYGRLPDRIDGHHHMHLCGNIIFGGLLPSGSIVRRNFSFQSGEKSWGNRLYRQSVDRLLAKHHHVVDLFYSLAPLEPYSRLERIFSLRNNFVIEVETHPINQDEYRLLSEGEIFRHFENLTIAPRFSATQRIS